jgi:hypothetical protein
MRDGRAPSGGTIALPLVPYVLSTSTCSASRYGGHGRRGEIATWSDAAWSDAAWGSAAWSDAAWSDQAADDPSIDPNATAATDDEMSLVESNLGIVDLNCDPSLNVCTAP